MNHLLAQILEILEIRLSPAEATYILDSSLLEVYEVEGYGIAVACLESNCRSLFALQLLKGTLTEHEIPLWRCNSTMRNEEGNQNVLIIKNKQCRVRSPFERMMAQFGL